MGEKSDERMKEAIEKHEEFSYGLLILFTIYEYQKNGEVASFEKINNKLQNVVPKGVIINILNELEDYGLIESEFGEVGDGRAGRLYSVSPDVESIVLRGLTGLTGRENGKVK